MVLDYDKKYHSPIEKESELFSGAAPTAFIAVTFIYSVLCMSARYRLSVIVTTTLMISVNQFFVISKHHHSVIRVTINQSSTTSINDGSH